MRMYRPLHLVIVVLFLVFPPVNGKAQESSATQVLGDIATNVLGDKAGFTEEEKDIIRRFYRGPKSSEDDWRKADTNDNEYSWKSDEEDEEQDDGGKKHKGKKKGSKKMPPGLAKKDELPPGLQKQLEKNGTLPPGLAKRDLPDDLVKLLPERPDTQERTVVDEDVLLVEKATGRILDILYGGARTE